jgi:hypothetical protein
MPAPADLTGQRFGRLTAAWPAGIQGRARVWLCFCDCGNFKSVGISALLYGRTRSCGCLLAEEASKRAKKAFYKHGHGAKGKETLTYVSWQAMKSRCLCPSATSYAHYGGRGIKVCDRWLHSYENFLADMGERPEGKTLDRYPNPAGNYEPGNCRWATVQEQADNREIPRAD